METIEDHLTIREFYAEGALYERQEVVHEPDSLIETITITDGDGVPVANREILYDKADRQLRFEEKDAKGNVLKLIQYEYDEELLIFEKLEMYDSDEYYEITYDYDERKNLISEEIKTPSGQLLEYHKRIFDENNCIISENGYSVGSFNAIYGTHVNGEKYNFEHEYQETHSANLRPSTDTDS